MNRILISFNLIVFALGFNVLGQTFVSVQSGSWENGGTWGNNSPGQNGVDYPSNGDNVVISANTVVTQSSQERPMRVII